MLLIELIQTEIKQLQAFKDDSYDRDNETIDSYIGHFQEIMEEFSSQLPKERIILSDMNTWCEVSESIERVASKLGYEVNVDTSEFDNYVWVFQK